MPQRYFIWFAYNGARYHGWQVQPNGNSVQAELEKALATLLRMPVPTTGAGRTDAGVHASCMVAHFDLDRDIDCDQLAYKLNRLLPYDIAVSRIQPVQPDMHARFSAVAAGGTTPVALRHHGQPVPAQYGAGRRGHTYRCGPRPYLGRRVPADSGRKEAYFGG